MLSCFFSKLNLTVFSGFERAVIGQRNSINLILGKGKLFSRNLGSYSFQARTMAASNSKSLIGDVYVDDVITSCGNALEFSKPTGVFFNDKSRTSCQKASLSLRRKEMPNSQLTCRYFLTDVTRRNCNTNVVVGPQLRNLHASFLACHSAGAAHDVSLDGGSRDEQLPSSTISSEQYVLLFHVNWLPFLLIQLGMNCIFTGSELSLLVLC